MKLSIISPLISNQKELKSFLNCMKEQTTQDFETILVINSISDQMYDYLEKSMKFLGSRLKIIINTSKRSLQHNLISAFNVVEGDYVNIMFSNNVMRNYFVERMNGLIQQFSNVDVIEFKPRLVGSIRWKPEARIEQHKVFNIKDNPSFLAFSYPIISNKIIKKELLQNFLKYQPVFSNDANFSPELTYLLLMEAKNYVYHDQRIIREYIDYSSWMNPKNFVEEWEKILNVARQKQIKITHELDYAYVYFFQIFLAGILGLSTYLHKDEYKEKKSYKLVKDLEKMIDKFYVEKENFYNVNIYMQNNNKKEFKLLQQKLDIKKWNEILSYLE